jgi:deazaflavin-dependent oxidoreductase (nitroreductase family)
LLVNDWNTQVIEQFRANHGRVGDRHEGRPIVLVHSVGRRSGKAYVNPLAYLPGPEGTIYIFATKAGSSANPDWYYNLVAAGDATVEVGDETFKVTVQELTGPERDRVYAEQAAANPVFGEYAEKTAGVRVIPVLALARSLCLRPLGDPVGQGRHVLGGPCSITGHVPGPDLVQDRVLVGHDVGERPQVECPEHRGPVLLPEQRPDVPLEAEGLG